MKFETPKNKNYCAVVCEIDKLVALPNCNNVQAAILFGNSVIVSITTKPGEVGLFFPAETALSESFLGANNLYSHPEWGNVDPLKKGYFEKHGRIKVVKFRGHKSEGFWIPINSLSYLGIDLDEFKVGSEFDKIGDKEICTKYIPSVTRMMGGGSGGKQGRKPRAEDKLVQGQFRFHIDTEQLGRNMHKISPDDTISISSKWHGTSAIFAHILVKKELKWYERWLQKLGVKIQDQEYGYTWSSRNVVKGVDEEKPDLFHYYGTDLWGAMAKKIKLQIPKGVTVYGEIVGYTPGGAGIQKAKNGKAYHYGCAANENKLVVYRVTMTNEDGKVIEFSWPQMKQFCAKYGFEMVKEIYYGKAGDFGSKELQYLQHADIRDWRAQFVEEVRAKYAPDEMCPYNNMEVPLEGVVVRLDHLEECEAYKLKSFLFKSDETAQLDAGVLDMETEESQAVEEPVEV